MKDVRDELVKRSQSVEQRGPNDVWLAANQQAKRGASHQRPFSALRLAGLACTAIVVLGGLTGVWYAGDRSENVADSAAGTVEADSAPETTAPPSDESDKDETQWDTDGEPERDYQKEINRDLSDVYAECVSDLGGEVDIAEVAVNPDGFPLSVKAGPYVSDPFHAPCFAKVGGSVLPDQSSNDDTFFLDCADPLIQELETPCLHEEMLNMAKSQDTERPSSSVLDKKRSADYRSCVAAADSDLSDIVVEVFSTPGQKVAGLTADTEITSEVHGYCYAKIGGMVLGGTSSAEQVWIDDCDVATNADNTTQQKLNCAQEE